MYGQLYHRTISRELREPRRSPRGAGGGPQARVAAGRGWAQAAPRVGGTRLARGRGSVGAGLGLGRCRRARIDGRDASARAARGRQEEPDRQLIPTAMGSTADGGVRGRDACKTAAMNAGEMAGSAGRGGHKRDDRGGRMQQAGQAHAAGRKARSAMPRVACRCRMAQSPFGRTAGRCRGKAARRWQHLRAMRDFGFLDAKEGPWRQDSRAMHPESPDCARKWMHRARMLPS